MTVAYYCGCGASVLYGVPHTYALPEREAPTAQMGDHTASRSESAPNLLAPGAPLAAAGSASTHRTEGAVTPKAGAKPQLEVESPVAATPGRGDGPMAEPDSQLSTSENA